MALFQYRHWSSIDFHTHSPIKFNIYFQVSWNTEKQKQKHWAKQQCNCNWEWFRIPMSSLINVNTGHKLIRRSCSSWLCRLSMWWVWRAPCTCHKPIKLPLGHRRKEWNFKSISWPKILTYFDAQNKKLNSHELNRTLFTAHKRTKRPSLRREYAHRRHTHMVSEKRKEFFLLNFRNTDRFHT